MKRILVPTDFSTCAQNAIDFAVESAKKLPAEIILLHALEIKNNIYTDYMGLNREFNQSIKANMIKKLSLLIDSIENTENIVVKISVSTEFLSTAIIEEIEKNSIDLVIMGTLGASGIKEKFFGSNTAKIIMKSKVPILVIPYGYQWKKPENILMVTNNFENSEIILDYLFELANLFLAKVKVAVFTDEDDDDAFTILQHTRQTPIYENMLKEKYQEETLTATHLIGKEFEETIEKYIEENEIDIIAMFTYQRNFFKRLFNPSITKRMSYHTNIPLLSIPIKSE